MSMDRFVTRSGAVIVLPPPTPEEKRKALATRGRHQAELLLRCATPPVGRPPREFTERRELAAKLGEQYAEGDGAVAVRQLLDAHNAATAAAAAAAAAAAVLPVPDDDSDVDSQDDGAGSTTSEEAHGGAGRDKADATAPQRRPALDPKWRNFIALALVNRDVRGVQRGFHKALDVYNKYKDVFEANGVTLRAVRDVLTAAAPPAVFSCRASTAGRALYRRGGRRCTWCPPGS